jgi:hypothetical protein
LWSMGIDRTSVAVQHGAAPLAVVVHDRVVLVRSWCACEMRSRNAPKRLTLLGANMDEVRRPTAGVAFAAGNVRALFPLRLHAQVTA